jgi:putative ABC transport system permease protein
VHIRVSALVQDVRYGIRMLAKSPGFAVVAILTLALGIGANAAIFELINAVRLRTLPVRDPDTLAIVHVERNNWGQGNWNGPYGDFTYPLWKQVQQRQEAFSSIAAWSNDGVNLATGGLVDNANAVWVSGSFFSTLGVQPFAGRLISEADDQPGCAGVIDISYAFWQRRFGGAADAVGKQLTLQGHPLMIVGVTAPSFYGVAVGEQFDVAAPICSETIVHGADERINAPNSRETWWLSIFGRLKPGWRIERASAQLGAITPAALNQTIPPQYDADGVKHYLAYKFTALPASNGFSNLRQNTTTSLMLLLGLSGLVLLIACANLANLMLARGSAREREIAVRLALGASRGRLTAQLVSESALLAVAGAVCGVALASVLSRFLVSSLSKPNSPIFLDMPMDWRVLGFSTGLAMLTTLLFGLLPALRSGSVAPGNVLKSGGRGMTAGRERFRLQKILVASQVALSLVLLAGALLFARSLRNLMARDPGFQQDGILVVNADYTSLNLTNDQREPFSQNLLERIRAIPAVESAAVARRSPVNGNSSNDAILGENGQSSKGVAWIDYLTPGYFQTMETSILAGRDFDSNDTATSQKVAIVNESFVKKILDPNKNPIGQRFRLWQPPGAAEPYYSVVGVVRDSTYNDMHIPFVPVTYFPRIQDATPRTRAVYLVRSRIGASALTSAVKDTIASLNPEVSIRFTVLTTQIRLSLVQDELMATLCGFFGVLAILLAAIGLYGVISYTVAQRANEIGIRMALGAQRSRVLRLILSEVLVLIGLGVVVGVGLTLAGSKAASSMLFGLKPRDPLTIAAAVLILVGIGVAASLVPARRAAQLDPMTALRNE